MIDKERLEDIRAEVEQMAYTSPLNFEKTRINKESVLWLIERVQDLKIMLKVLGEENQRYKHALEFYANSKNWIPQNDDVLSEITMDYGSKARQALEGKG